VNGSRKEGTGPLGGERPRGLFLCLVLHVWILHPFDAQTCIDSVMRTGRLVVLQEGQWSGGLGHTIQSRILESCFYALESAPCVIGALDTPVPFSPPLENHTIPSVEHVVEILRTSCN